MMRGCLVSRLVEGRGECPWDEFAEKLCERFGERSRMDVVEELTNLSKE